MTDERKDLVASKISAERSGTIAISGEAGGLDVRDMAQLFEVAKFMSMARFSIPAFLRGNPWDCLAIILQARQWRMDPYSVARMAYAVQSRGGEQAVGYMSQLIHVVLETRPLFKKRLDVRYEGEGEDTVCVVTATLLDGDVKEHRSPKLSDRRKGTTNSPLWRDKPLVQLMYDTTRDLARIYFPDIIMGVYSDDELGTAGFEEIPAKDLARMPAQVQMAAEESLSSRLSPEGAKRAGFNLEHVVSEIDGPAKTVAETSSSTQPSAGEDAASATVSSPAPTGGGDASPRPEPPPASAAPSEPSAQPREAAALPASGATTKTEAPSGGAATAPEIPTEAEYKRRVLAYTFAASSIAQLEEVWKKERTIRNKIVGLTPETVDELKRAINAKVAELRAKA